MYAVGMRILAGLLIGAALIPLAETTGQSLSAGEMFAARCANCHTVPNPALRTDLAWLDQINRTT